MGTLVVLFTHQFCYMNTEHFWYLRPHFRLTAKTKLFFKFQNCRVRIPVPDVEGSDRLGREERGRAVDHP